jgi:hypothetical protein
MLYSSYVCYSIYFCATFVLSTVVSTVTWIILFISHKLSSEMSAVIIPILQVKRLRVGNWP